MHFGVGVLPRDPIKRRLDGTRRHGDSFRRAGVSPEPPFLPAISPVCIECDGSVASEWLVAVKLLPLVENMVLLPPAFQGRAINIFALARPWKLRFLDLGVVKLFIFGFLLFEDPLLNISYSLIRLKPHPLSMESVGSATDPDVRCQSGGSSTVVRPGSICGEGNST